MKFRQAPRSTKEKRSSLSSSELVLMGAMFGWQRTISCQKPEKASSQVSRKAGIFACCLATFAVAILSQ